MKSINNKNLHQQSTFPIKPSPIITPHNPHKTTIKPHYCPLLPIKPPAHIDVGTGVGLLKGAEGFRIGGREEDDEGKQVVKVGDEGDERLRGGRLITFLKEY